MGGSALGCLLRPLGAPGCSKFPGNLLTLTGCSLSKENAWVRLSRNLIMPIIISVRKDFPSPTEIGTNTVWDGTGTAILLPLINVLEYSVGILAHRFITHLF